jgi:hypothetical protein
VHGARRITLVTTNTGMIATGTASSSPAGLACDPNSTCTALFETDVLLTAVPGPNSAVGSWSVAGCGTATTCNVVVAPTPITVTVNFVISNAGLLNITFAGTSVGLIRVVDGSITHDCTSDCTLPITPGNTIKVRPSTPSKFGGMTGVCPVMPDSDLVSCSFTAPMGTSNLGVTFDKYPNELWTRVLGESGDDALHVEYDGSGNVIVAYKNGLTKLSPTGATLWTISTLVTSLAVGPGDGDFIYVGTGGGVMKVAPNGVVLWSSAANTFGTDLLDHIAVAPDGAVALRSGTLNGTAIVRRWNNGGALTWTKTFTVPNQDTTVGSIIFDRFETLYVVFNTGARRFAPDGTELAPLAQAVPDVASRLQITSNTLRSMFVGGVAPNFVRFEGSLDLATGTYTQTSNLGGAEPIEPGFVLPNFGFGISNNGHNGDADFYQLDNGTSDTFPMAFRINGAFDRKVYYHEDGMGPIGPFGGAVPRNIAYHRTSTASAQFVLSGNWDGLAWVQAFSD